MKTTLGVLIGVLILIITLSYFHVWLISLSSLYLLVSIVFFFLQFKQFLKIGNVNNMMASGINSFIHFTVPLNAKRNYFQKLIFYSKVFFEYSNNSVCWPVIYFRSWRANTNHKASLSESVATVVLRPVKASQALFYFGISILVVICYQIRITPTQYLLFYSSFFCIGGVSLLFTFLIGNEDLANIFKNSPNNIIKGVISVCFCLTVSFFSFLCVITSVYYDLPFNLEVAKIVFNDFFKQESIGLIWSGKLDEVRTLHFLINLVGLLFAATIIDTLKSFKSFSRQAANYKTIAFNFLQQKQYNKALNWLQKIPESSWDQVCWQYNIILLIGLNQTNKAIACFPHIIIKSEESDFVQDQKFLQVIQFARTFDVDIVLIHLLYRKWISVCQCDGLLYTSMLHGRSMYTEPKYPMDFVNEIKKRNDEDNSLPLSTQYVDFVNNDFDTDDFLQILTKEIDNPKTDKMSKCLAYVNLLILCSVYEIDAENEFERLTEYENVIAEIHKPTDLFYVLAITLGLLKGAESRPSFYETALFIYTSNKKRISGTQHTTTFETLERLFIRD